MTNKSKFNGWGGNTEFTTLDLIKTNLSGSTQTLNMSSPIIEGPVTINKTPQNGPSRTKNSEPVFITATTQTQTVSNRRSLTVPQGIDLPFTAGTVDYSFPAGGGFGVDGFDGAVYHIAVDSDGRYVIGGGFVNYYYNGDSYRNNRLIRLNTDGTIDESFDISYNEDCYGGGFDDTVYTLEIQPDGKILVGGAFTRFDRDGDCDTFNSIIRLNSDGSRDTTFNIGDGFNGNVYDIHVQPDGKIIVGGEFTQYNNIDAYRIIRLNSNGSIDSSFLIGDGDVAFSGPDDCYVNVIELQSDGKILVGGYFTTYGFSTQNYITRLNSDGTLDTTFQTGNGFDTEVMTIALQSDGKIIVGGYFYLFDNNDLFSGHIVRLSSNGTLDTLFGYGLDNQVHSLAIQSDGKILVGGYFNNYYDNNNNRLPIDELVRFHSDCSFDYSFSYDDILNSGVEYITILEDDNILIGGFFGNADPTVYPLNYFGRLHNSISVYPYTYNVVACARPLMDERITYVVGSMTPLEFESVHSFQSLRNPSVTVCGYIDYSYPSNLIEYVEVNSYSYCGDAYIDNYKLVTVEDCYFPYIDDGMTFWVVDKKYEVGDILYIDMIYDADGRTFSKFAAQIKTDENWNVPYPIWDYLPSINYAPYSSCEEAVDSNGLIYGANSCTEMESTYPLIHKAIYGPTALLIPTGDNPVKVLFNYYSYGPYEFISGGTPEIYSFVNLGDINSESYEDLCSLGLTKVSPEGVLNGGFRNTGFDGSLVYTMVEQPDGKILVGGNFNDYLEVPVGNFMRINPDGSLDETFYLGQFNNYIRAIALQPDGKILVGGNFTNYDGYNAGRIIRLNSDGTIDSGFTFNSEFNGIVRAIAIQKDGKIVVGGGFSYYYDFYCPQIVRLNSNGTPDRTFVMGDGFDGDDVFTINIESIRNTPFYNENGPVTYTENIVVGGWFNWYNGTNVGGIVKLSPTGEILPDFGDGFNVDTGSRPRVNQILTQPDGKLVIIGGADGGYLRDYNNTWIPQNIVRLVKVNRQYVIDETFTTRNWDNNGGFDGAVLSASLLPNGKIMLGGQFNDYEDNNSAHNNIPYLVRLNSNGTLDETFTFDLDDDYVNKTLLLSSGRLLVGGRFNSPYDRLLELFIGEEYELHSFITCDNSLSNIYLPTNDTQLGIIKANVNNRAAVCGLDNGVITTPQLTQSGGIGGSMYFGGDNNTMVQVDNSAGQFGFGGAGEWDLTIEWFQYWGGEVNTPARPFSIGTYGGGTNVLQISFEGGGLLWIGDGQTYNLGLNLTDLENKWIHFAITRYFNGSQHLWSVYVDGLRVVSEEPYSIDLANTYPLVIGNQTDNDGIFKGYITNFRINNQSAIYSGPNITVPTSPLTCDANVILLITSNDEDNLDNDICAGQSSSNTGVTWSSESPFVNALNFSLFTATDFTSYNSCEDCGQLLSTILYVRTGVTEYVTTRTMTKTNIDNVLANGPIFTTGGVEAYEIINYYY